MLLGEPPRKPAPGPPAPALKPSSMPMSIEESGSSMEMGTKVCDGVGTEMTRF